MSTSLYWRLPPKLQKEHYLDTSLKYLLARKLFDGDGSSGQDPIIVGHDITPYLDGIIDGADASSDLCKSASKLKSAIEEYGEIELLIHS